VTGGQGNAAVILTGNFLFHNRECGNVFSVSNCVMISFLLSVNIIFLSNQFIDYGRNTPELLLIKL
jgi:hypothetical protein